MDAIFDGRVIEEEKDVHGIGIGIGKDLFAEHLEGSGTILARVGDDSVCDFEAVDVRLVFLIATVSVADGVCGESEESDEKKKCRESGPVSDFLNAPTSAALRK